MSFSRNNIQKNSGFSFVELLVVIAVLTILWAFLFVVFKSLNSAQALDKDALLVASTIERARVLTLSGRDESSFGVRIKAEQVVLFKGLVYNPNDLENQSNNFSGQSVVSATVWGSGSGDDDSGGDDSGGMTEGDIIFERLTGETSNSVTITVSLKSNPSSSKTVTVWPTGIVDVN